VILVAFSIYCHLLFIATKTNSNGMLVNKDFTSNDNNNWLSGISLPNNVLNTYSKKNCQWEQPRLKVRKFIKNSYTIVVLKIDVFEQQTIVSTPGSSPHQC